MRVHRAQLADRFTGRFVSLLLAAALAACSPAPQPTPFELRDVADARLAELELSVADARAVEALPDDSAGDAPGELAGEHAGELAQRVNGLVTYLATAEGPLADTALEEARLLGDPLVRLVAPIVVEPSRPDDERLAAARLMAAAGTRQAAEQLLAVVEHGEPGWLRANAAWLLADLGQAWVVPRLLLRLKYEKHHEAAVFLAAALGRLGNYSGAAVLQNLAASGNSPAVREKAAAQLASLARTAGLASGGDLVRAWYLGDGRLDPAYANKRGADYALEVWRRIALLHDFQLRGVDDSRFVLERLGSIAAEALAEALHDSSPYVRVHVAQSLERMGPRGQVAGPDLVLALQRADLAGNAAAALGRLGWQPGEQALLEHLGPERSLELRVASARALGNLGLASSAPGLRALVNDTSAPVDLVQTAAESLVYVGSARDGVPRLVELLEDPRVDAASSSAALRWWLVRRVADGSTDAVALLEEWDTLAPPPGSVEPSEIRARRHAAEAELLRGALERLLP